MKKNLFIYIYRITVYSYTPFRKCYTFNVRLAKSINSEAMKQQVVSYLAEKHNLVDVITSTVSEPVVINVNDCRFPKTMLSSVIMC